MLCLLIASVDAPEEKRKIEQLYEKYNPAYVQHRVQIIEKFI